MLERSFTGTPDDVVASAFSMFDDEHEFAFMPAPEPRVTVDSAALGGSRLFRVSSTGHRINLSERTLTTVLLVRRGSARFRTKRCDFVARQGDLVVMTPNSRATSVMPDARDPYVADVAMLRLPPLSVEGRERDAVASPFEHRYSGAALDRPDAPVRRYLAFLFSEIERRDSPLANAETATAAERLLVDEVAQLMVLTDEAERRRLSHSPSDLRLVRMAEEMMRAEIGEPLAIAAIARDLGVSIRRLQLAFNAVGSATPRTRLAELRLEEARARLLAPRDHDTVSAIAFDSGFAHLGRFSRAYFDRFSEFPSQTLRKAKS